jgi:hypothetical protein
MVSLLNWTCKFMMLFAYIVKCDATSEIVDGEIVRSVAVQRQLDNLDWHMNDLLDGHEMGASIQWSQRNQFISETSRTALVIPFYLQLQTRTFTWPAQSSSS